MMFWCGIHDVKQQIANNSDLRDKIEVLYKPTNVDIIADKGRLYQVISNLLSNAVKFSERGSISVDVQRSETKVTVSVRDAGLGIDSEILPRRFSKFASKSENGTGLGLFISRSIVELTTEKFGPVIMASARVQLLLFLFH